MDFFNKLGKKASEAAQITKDKTAKLSGEIKLRSKISDCKTKISTIYAEMGKLAFADLENGVTSISEEIKEKAEEIKKLNEEIAAAESEILALKDIKKCEACGAEIALGVEFCPKCGKAQPKVEVAVEVEEAETETVETTEEAPVEEEKTEE